jgi:hypothetical protein
LPELLKDSLSIKKRRRFSFLSQLSTFGIILAKEQHTRRSDVVLAQALVSMLVVV